MMTGGVSMECPICKIDFDSKLGKCPICGSILVENNNKEKDISIQLDFSQYNCPKCNKKLMYNEKICPKCKNNNSSDIGDGIDPIVNERREKLNDVVDTITNLDKNIKGLRKNIRSENQPKIVIESFIDYVISKTEEISCLSAEKIYKDIAFTKNIINTHETLNNIIKIKEHLIKIYKIYEDMLLVDAPYLWMNLNERLCNIVEKLISANKLIVNSIVSDELKEVLECQKRAQKMIDDATYDTKVISDILNIKNLEVNFNLVEDGTFNASLFAIMLGSNENKDITSQYKKIQVDSYNYFKDFLVKDLEYYLNLEQPCLMQLSSYRFMAMTSFIEKRYMEKVKIVINVLEEAKNINSKELENFTYKFKVKYLYALRTINNIFEESLISLSYCKKDKIFIKSILGWYKDLTEGVYRDVTSIIIASGNIIDKKPINYEQLLMRQGFSDKLSYLENKKKLHLDKLTDGLYKIIRNSEAHVDYDIDDKEKRIYLRDKGRKGQEDIRSLSYTYEEFVNIYNTLQETILAIMAGIDIFMANNYEEFEDFIVDTKSEMDRQNKEHAFEYLLGLLGITDIKSEYINENNKLVFEIKGTSIYRTDKELLNKCVPCAVPIIQNNDLIDVIKIELVDKENNCIGSLRIDTKYIRNRYKVIDRYKKYEDLLLLNTMEIDYLYKEYNDIDDYYEFKFTITISKWCMDLLEELRNHNNIDTINEILNEVDYSINTIKEYIVLVNNKLLLNFLLGLMCNVKEVVYLKIDLLRDKKNINKYNKLYKEICFELADVFGTKGEDSRIKLLLVKYTVKENKIGRNDLCPCGSGKKYKKCCMGLIE